MSGEVTFPILIGNGKTSTSCAELLRLLDKLSFSFMLILYWFYSLSARNICQIILMNFISINKSEKKLNYYPDLFKSQSNALEMFFLPMVSYLER